MNLSMLFSEFENTAFRLESRAEYRVVEEFDAVAHFANTGEVLDGTNAEWAALIANARSSGKRMQRLRLFSDSLSEYERFEVQVYRIGIAAGEEIRVAARPDPLPGDFWLFDNRWIAEMHYADDGAFEGASVHEASEADLENADHWRRVFADSPRLEETSLGK